MIMEIKIINSEEQYKAYLSRMNEIFHAEEGTPEGGELNQLALVLEKYESEHYPMDWKPKLSLLRKLQLKS